MLDTTAVYEIEFGVLDGRRERFDAWLAADVVEWVGHESVAAFEVLTSDQQATTDSKFVFEFETLHDWATFVESDAHETAVDNLNVLTTDYTATLWRRGSVSLDRTVGDGGEPQPHTRQSGPVT